MAGSNGVGEWVWRRAFGMNTAIGSKKALQANCSVKNVGRTIAWCCGNQDHWWLSAKS